MACCGGNERDPESKLVASPDFNGPIENRGCTDILCYLLLLAMWVAMTVVGYIAIDSGDYRVLVNPVDYAGNVCGIKYNGVDMTDYPFKYYVNFYGDGICTSSCPKFRSNDAVSSGNVTTNSSSPDETESDLPLFDPYSLLTFDGLFQVEGATLDTSFIGVPNYNGTDVSQSCTSITCYPNNSPNLAFLSTFGINQGFGFAFFVLDTVPALNRCLPTEDAFVQVQTAINVTILDSFDNLLPTGLLNNVSSDLWLAKYWVLGFGFGVSLAISFLYLMLLRFPCVLETMVWGSVLLVNVLLLGGGVLLFLQADQWAVEDPQVRTDSEINNAKIVSYVLFALGAIYFLLVCCLRKQIQLAIGTVEEGSKAVNAMPFLTFLPVIQGVSLLAFLAIWMVYLVFLIGNGEMVTEAIDNTLIEYELDHKVFKQESYVIWGVLYLIFCLFWTFQFISSMGEIIIALSVSKWYFTRDKSTIGNSTVVQSLCSACFYHVGTAAFGSLVLAIVRFLRAILAYVQKQAKDADNKLAEILLCGCACCMWCLDNFLRFLNKNAYIQTAIFGYGFCRSATEAFYLIARNAGKIGALTYVTQAVGIVGKLFITTATTVASWAAIDYFLADEVTYITAPAVLVAILAYFVSDAFMDIFDLAITTVLHCFIADDEMYDEDEAFAGPDLRKFIDDWE